MTIVSEVLERLVSIDTVTDSKSGKRPSMECPKYITEKLSECGFITEILESNGFYTALGRKGQGAFKILFLAHFDVVPPGEGWNSKPFSLVVSGDKAYGRGTCDDKGNIVSLLSMAKDLENSDFPCTVMIAASGDEEIGGRNGAYHLRDYLVKQGLFPDYVVIADGINQTVIYRRRNILPTEIKAKQTSELITGKEETVRFATETYGGETRHSAYMRPGVDRHAMLTASKYLELNGHSVVKNVRGGFVKSNVVPDWVEMDVIHPTKSGKEIDYDPTLTGIMQSLLPLSQANFPTEYSDLGTIVSPNLLSLDDDLWNLYLDVRAMTNDAESVENAFTQAICDRFNLFSLKTHGGAGFVNSDRNSKLIRAAEWTLKKEDISYKLIEGYGASDSRFFADSALVFDFGPIGGNLHGPNEWVSLKSIEENARFYHGLIDTLVRDPTNL